MKVVELTNVLRRESPLLYRRTYTATAVLSDANADPESRRIEFVIEHAPIGPVQIRVKSLDPPEVQADADTDAIENRIRELEGIGELP